MFAALRSRIDRRALVDTIPLILPAIPFGFVLGIAITESEMPIWAAALTSPLVFAGAAQLAVVTIAGTASVFAVILAAMVINSRHVMYSAALASTFRHQPAWVRWLGPHVLIDQTFALASLQKERDPPEFRRYYLTAGATFYVFWNLVVPLGMVVGPIVPTSWRLDFAPAVMFAGITLLAVDRRPAALAAFVGGTVSLVTAGLPDRLGIVIGALAGIGAGTALELAMEPDLARAEEVRR